MVEAEVSQEKTHQPQMTVVGHSSYIHTHRHIHTRTNMHTHIHTSGNLLTDCIYCAGEETAPQPASGTADRGVKKPKGGGARTTLKATTNSSTLKERAGVRSRGLTGKGASTSNDSGGSLFLHAHTHIRTHTYTHIHTHTCTCRHTHTRMHTHAHAYTQVAICSLMVSILQEKRLSLSLQQAPLAEEAKGLRIPNVVVPGPHSKPRPTRPL